MAKYPFLVDVAWKVLDRFLLDWQTEPYKWSREVNFQAEIATRLRNVYELMDCNTLIGNYGEVPLGLAKDQRWSRVYCEPKIWYTYKDAQRYFCYPDVVVHDDIPNPHAPPDRQNKTNWPLLWACELKVWADDTKDENWDTEKMSYLIKNSETQYACWVNIRLERAASGNGIEWKQPEGLEGVWVCDAKLPSLEHHVANSVR